MTDLVYLKATCKACGGDVSTPYSAGVPGANVKCGGCGAVVRVDFTWMTEMQAGFRDKIRKMRRAETRPSRAKNRPQKGF